MTQHLTVHQTCRLDLECPDGVPAPGHASHSVLKYMFSVRGKSVLDLGCGTGLFAIAAAKLGADEAWATDASRAAVDCTRRNAERNGVDVVAKLGELFEPVAGRTFDLIVTLPPGTDSPEPRFDEDGVRYFEAVLREAPEYLERGGELLTCLPAAGETSRFESLLREGFRYRQLPETRVELRPGDLPRTDPGRVVFLRSYLAMKL